MLFAVCKSPNGAANIPLLISVADNGLAASNTPMPSVAACRAIDSFEKRGPTSGSSIVIPMADSQVGQCGAASLLEVHSCERRTLIKLI